MANKKSVVFSMNRWIFITTRVYNAYLQCLRKRYGFKVSRIVMCILTDYKYSCEIFVVIHSRAHFSPLEIQGIIIPRESRRTEFRGKISAMREWKRKRETRIKNRFAISRSVFYDASVCDAWIVASAIGGIKNNLSRFYTRTYRRNEWCN